MVLYRRSRTDHTITSDQLVLATTISDKVVTICSLYLLTLLTVTSDCKDKLMLVAEMVKELSILVVLLTVPMLPMLIFPLPELLIFADVLLFVLYIYIGYIVNNRSCTW